MSELIESIRMGPESAMPNPIPLKDPGVLLLLLALLALEILKGRG